MVLPYIDMNPPWVYICSPCWTPLPPPSPSHPSLKCALSCSTYALQPLGGAQVFFYRASSIHKGKIEKVSKESQRPNEVSRTGLLVNNWKGLWVELNWSKPSLSLLSLGRFSSQLLVSLLESFVLLAFSSSRHVDISLASLLRPLYWECLSPEKQVPAIVLL